MAYKLPDTEQLMIHDVLAMVRGTVTQDKHHFYGSQNDSGQGAENDYVDYLGGTVPKVLRGSRIPMNKLTNNPSLSSPSVIGMKYFGQLPIFKSAVDQIIHKKIGVFPIPILGAGMNAFQFQNSSLFGSAEQTIQSLVGTVLFGSSASAITQGHQLYDSLQSLSRSIGQVIGGDDTTKVSPANDTAKIMQGLSAGFASATTSPFDTSIFADAVTLAKDVTQMIQKINS